MGSIMVDRLLSFGVPINVPIPKDIIGWNVRKIAPFVKSNKNLIIMGKDYYKKCIRTMMLKIVAQGWLNCKWLSQSQLCYELINELKNVDVLALVMLFDDIDYRKTWPGFAIGSVLSNGGQILLGCEDASDLEGAFPHDLERIENEFDIWKD